MDNKYQNEIDNKYQNEMDNKYPKNDPAAIIANMTIAHEMIMSDNFQLKPITDLKNGNIVKSVHNIVHQAFWDILESEISLNPPQYGNALKLLKEVKQLILDIVPKSQEKFISEIEEVLDEDLIKQEVTHGVFDLQHCAVYVINVLGKLCAPVRDEKVKELKKETMLVPLLRGTFELLGLMKIDMANYEIQKIKPIVIQQAADYERGKFNEYLENNPNGLDSTKIWMKQAFDVVKLLQTPESPTRNIRNVIITHAYLSLVDPDKELVYPETLLLDKERILKAAYSYKIFVYAAAILAIYNTYAGDHLTTDNEYMAKLKDTVLLLFENQKNDIDAIHNITEQLISETEKQIELRGLNKKEEDKTHIFKEQLRALKGSTEENQLIKLIKSRLRDYLLLSFSSETPVHPAPSVLKPIATEIKDVTDIFVRVIRHNRLVFHQNYNDILNEYFNFNCTRDDEKEKS